MWYFYALLGPAIWALLNHLDKYLLRRFFERDAAGPVLVVFTGLAGIVLAVAILLFGSPVFALAAWQAFFLVGAGALLVASYIPYMIALQRDEASIVASLYRLAPLFVFALSYMVLGESLRPRQIAGGFVTIAGSILLIVDLDNGRRAPKLLTFFLMCAACLMSAGTVVIFKFIALQASFWSAAFWEYIGAGLFSIGLICGMPSYRRALLTVLRSRGAYGLGSLPLGGEADDGEPALGSGRRDQVEELDRFDEAVQAQRRGRRGDRRRLPGDTAAEDADREGRRQDASNEAPHGHRRAGHDGRSFSIGGKAMIAPRRDARISLPGPWLRMEQHRTPGGARVPF